MGKSMADDIEEEDFIEDDEIILENAVLCPQCNEVAGHAILKETPKGTGADYLLKCDDCEKVHIAHIRPHPVVNIPFELNEGPSSNTNTIEIDAEETRELEDVIEEDEKL